MKMGLTTTDEIKMTEFKLETFEQGKELTRMLDAGEVPEEKRQEARDALLSLKERLDVKPRSEQNFFERFSDDIAHRFGEQGAEIINARVSGDQGFLSTAAQLTGKVGAGSVLDLMGELVVSGGRGLSAITPDVIEDPIVDSATAAGYKLLESDLGQRGLKAAEEGIEAYRDFAEEHPVMARNIEALTNVALLVAPVKGSPRAMDRTRLSRIGETIELSGVRGAAAKRKALAQDLVKPEQTRKARMEQARFRTEESGPLRSKKVKPTEFEQQMAKEVLRTNISPRKTLQGNLNAIAKAADDEAARLVKNLPNRPYIFKELERELKDAVGKMPEAITGDARKMAAEIIGEFEKIARSRKLTLPNLLRARKDLDKWLKSQKPNVFDPARDSALSIATKAVRQTTNDFITARSGSQFVRRSLDRQHRLLTAAENLSTRAYKEGNNIITQTIQKVVKILPFRSEFNNMAAAVFGVGGLGASAMFAPYFTKLAASFGGVYIGGKLVMAPNTREGLGVLIQMLDKAVMKTTDPALLMELRMHRAAIVEMIKDAEEKE